MILVQLWVLTEEGFDKEETGQTLDENDYEFQSALVDPMEISHAYKSNAHPDCIVIQLKQGDALNIKMTIKELYEAKQEYLKKAVISAMFSPH